MLPKTTLLFLYKPKEKKILLAMKKRKFGMGKWNGVGGKLDTGESVEDAAVREAKEEIGVIVNQNDLTQVATLNFIFKNDIRGFSQQVHVFFTERWSGEPIEGEEMKPVWYDIGALPFESMWIDDIHWLPLVLAGKKLEAVFNFNETGDQILTMKIKEI